MQLEEHMWFRRWNRSCPVCVCRHAISLVCSALLLCFSFFFVHSFVALRCFSLAKAAFATLRIDKVVFLQSWQQRLARSKEFETQERFPGIARHGGIQVFETRGSNCYGGSCISLLDPGRRWRLRFNNL